MEPGPSITVQTHFVRTRFALVARAQMSSLFVDHYLHLADLGIQIPGRADSQLKDLLAAISLHGAATPRDHTTAWTLSFQHPPLNLFAAVNNREGTIIGRAFTNDIRASPSQLFYSQVSRPNSDLATSTIDFEGDQVFRAVEAFYLRSEQRLARFFELEDEGMALVVAQPDCDLDWLDQLDESALRSIDQDEELGHLESRYYNYTCGCTEDRLLRLLAPQASADIEALFEGDPAIRVSCPRCGATRTLTRAAMESHLRG